MKPHPRRKLLKVASGVIRLPFTHSFLRGGAGGAKERTQDPLPCRRRELESGIETLRKALAIPNILFPFPSSERKMTTPTPPRRKK